MLEQPAENPFLGRFYADMQGYAFQTQLFFLFQRQRQVQAIAQPTMFAQTVVSDFMLAKDTIFAKLTLSDDEYRLYAQMYAPIAAQLPEPDVVVWLQASAADAAAARAPARRGDGRADRPRLPERAWPTPTPSTSRLARRAGAGGRQRALQSGRARRATSTTLIDRLERFDGRRGLLVADRQTSFG